jgi:hypothetical protein
MRLGMMSDKNFMMDELHQCVTGTVVTDEYHKLSEFAHNLCSFHSIADINDQSTDDGNIREEAQLLMNLLSPTLSGSCATTVSIGSVSPMSLSDTCHLSESKTQSHLQNQFSFTCPTLSLEKKSNRKETPLSRDELHPALLLGRSLKVEDRDALRLSSDAMARNILCSFQKSLQTRVDDWISALTRQLVRSEKEMAMHGAKSEEVHALLQTSEAILISKLRTVGECLSVASVRTSFHVLPEKIEMTENAFQAAPKRQRIDVGDNSDVLSKLAIEGQDNYVYTVYHRLKLQCLINIDTPAGFAEVSIDVPGIVEGTFCSVRENSICIRSVRVKLDTNMLAAMMEKSCRTLVRASVEAFLESEQLAILPISPQAYTAKDDGKSSERDSPYQQKESCSILKNNLLQPRPAFVTPKSNDEKYNNPQYRYSAASSSILMPIAEDLVSGKEHLLPKRISPHSNASSSGQPPRSNESSEEQMLKQNSEFKAPQLYQITRTDARFAKMERPERLPLISPPPSETQFKDIDIGTGPIFPSFPLSPKKRPAWPMLVEAAFYVKE